MVYVLTAVNKQGEKVRLSAKNKQKFTEVNRTGGGPGLPYDHGTLQFNNTIHNKFMESLKNRYFYSITFSTDEEEDNQFRVTVRVE